MALALYSAPNTNNQLSSLSPFTITFDGRVGGEQDKCVYLHNDSVTRWYDNITISIEDLEGVDLVHGANGCGWKLISKDIPPSNEEWSRVAVGNILALNLTLGSTILGDIVTFLPIWVRVILPHGMQVQTVRDIVLRIQATEHITDG